LVICLRTRSRAADVEAFDRHTRTQTDHRPDVARRWNRLERFLWEVVLDVRVLDVDNRRGGGYGDRLLQRRHLHLNGKSSGETNLHDNGLADDSRKTRELITEAVTPRGQGWKSIGAFRVCDGGLYSHQRGTPRRDGHAGHRCRGVVGDCAVDASSA